MERPPCYWLPFQRLILASGSEIRSRLLGAAGIEHDIIPASIDERAVEQTLESMDGRAIAAALAREKAKSISVRFPNRIVLGADQTLSFRNQLLHKVETMDEARVQLQRLRGETHELNSAIALVRDGTVVYEFVSVAKVTMRMFSASFLDFYLSSLGPAILSSVGCYHIEDEGIQLFESVEGDQFTIMGLPLLPLLNFMRQAGLLRM